MSSANNGLVRPVLEYGSSVWDPHTKGVLEEFEKVSNRAARLVTRNYSFEEGSMTVILEQLKWQSLKKRRTHYENMPMQYTEIFKVLKNENFQWNCF